MSVFRRLCASLAVAALACTDAGSASDEGRAAAVVAPPPPPYETIPLEEFGRIAGVVVWEGPVPRDTSFAVADSIARTCGGAVVRVAPVRVIRGGVTSSLVWLEGARRGKTLSPSRRFEIATDRCRLTPQVQAAISGGMLNVLSLDRLEHRLQFVRVGSEGTVGRVEQFDAGQVVPLESVLRLPGPVAVHSDRYPWMRAWIHVFDHPYFAATNDGGSFSIDSVPPGRYALAYWHPAAGRRDTTVFVTAGDTVRVRLVMPGGGE